MNFHIIFVFAVIGGYLLGSVPFGLVLTKMAGLGDIRKIGSGNIGATNVLRTGRKDLAILTVLCDALKAGVAALIVYYTAPTHDYVFFGNFTTLNLVAALIAGTSAILGHNFPIWLKFKGGKGVASTFGFVVLMSPLVGCIDVLTWLIIAFATRYSSLSALTAAVLLPIYTFFLLSPVYLYFYTFAAALLILRHHTNIRRLIKGEESKISFKKKDK